MLVDQTLDLTLAVIMLPMLVELHPFGIYFKCNTYDLYFMDSLSILPPSVLSQQSLCY